jgi:hypothetical protein
VDTLNPWLLLILAGLVIACQVFYLRMRRAESVRGAVESLQEEERRNLEATLATLIRDEPGTADPSAPIAAPGADWRPQAVLLSRCGVTLDEIALRLGVPVGEVELALRLAQTAESTKRGRE